MYGTLRRCLHFTPPIFFARAQPERPAARGRSTGPMSGVQKRARQEPATPGDLGDATPEPKRSRRSTANPSLKERPALTLVFEHDDCGGHDTCTPGAPHQEAADRLTAVHRAIARMDGVVFTSDFEPASLAALQHVHSDGLIEAVWQLCRKRDMAGQRRPSGWLAEAPEACSGAEREREPRDRQLAEV